MSRRDIVRLALAAVCWGLGTVLSKRALDEIAPLALFATQLAASLVILAILMRARGLPLRGVEPVLLGRLGLLNPGIAYPLSLVGLVTITVSLSVLLWALEPMLIILLAGVFLHERISRTTVVLAGAALAGIVLIVGAARGESQLVGVALTMAGVGCCAAYTVITRRWIPAATETTQVIVSQQAHALLLALPLVAVAAVLGGGVPAGPSPAGLASAIASGALYYAGAYWLYLGALRNVPASIAGTSFYLIPIVGLAAGALILGERLEPSQWIGTAIVMAAVVGIARQPTRAEPVRAEVVPA